VLSALLALALSGAPSTISVSFDPAVPVKGRDPSVRVTFEVSAALTAPGELRAVVSTGSLGPVARAAAPGRFEAIWTPAATAEPEVLGIVAVLPACPRCADAAALGGARLAVASAIQLPGRTDPGVETRVEVAGREWGPVRADAEGRFVIPIVVPPGARWGSARSQSSVGNERRQRIDLHLAEAPGLVCARWPDRVPSDGATEAGLACVAWTSAGGGVAPGSLVGTAAAGAVGAPVAVGELWTARYRPPAGGPESDRVTVALGRAGARQELTIQLDPGEPVAIEWVAEGEPFVPGSSVPVVARAVDAWGKAVGEAAAEGGSISGGRLRLRPELGEGVQVIALRFPADASSPAALRREVRVALRPGGSPDLEATLDGGWIHWRIRSPSGEALPGREVVARSDGVRLGASERVGDGGRIRILDGRGTVTVTDSESGASAVIETP
jgi:hypothetical protein